MRILIVEDEAPIRNGLVFNFQQEGYQVDEADDGQTAIEIFKTAEPPVDLIVLDLMLPGMSGYETCRQIRDVNDEVPILVLSARTLSEDRTMAFDCGTDQYMTKPFALPELLSRVRNLLDRRGRKRMEEDSASRSEGVREFGNVRVDFDSFQVTANGQTTELTTLELSLIRYFLKHSDRVLSRQELLDEVWGEDSLVTPRTVDNFVLRLRKLIEPNQAEPVYIRSVRGTGYRFVMPENEVSPSVESGQG